MFTFAGICRKFSPLAIDAFVLMLNSWSESFRSMISECPPLLLSVTPPLRSLEIKPNMLGRWIKEHESVDGQAFRGNFKLTAERIGNSSVARRESPLENGERHLEKSDGRFNLEKNGLILREVSIVDASIISALSSTKNESGQRDPEIYQTQKGNQWYFDITRALSRLNRMNFQSSLRT